MTDPDPRATRIARRLILLGIACLLVAVLGMLALGVALLRS